jgi:hypothetical protein
MKIRNILLLSVIAALPISVSADSFLSEKSVTYSGESNARKACKAVVHDDPEKLDKIFRQDLRSNVYRYSSHVRNRAIEERYVCNDLALLPFADQIGAVNVSGYLRKGRGKVTMEEMVSTRD